MKRLHALFNSEEERDLSVRELDMILLANK